MQSCAVLLSCCFGRLRRLALALLILFPVAVFAGTGSFRFAFLSDTHVGSNTGAEDLRATVKDLNSLTGLSFVVISGDITEYGSLEQFKLARQIFSGLKLPYHIIPGNHDTKWSESGATDFARVWGQDRFVFEQGGYRFIGIHEGPVMKMGDGHWAPQDVRWLDEQLKDMRNAEQPLVFVTHYPIDDGIANWYCVLDLLKRYNVQVVLCGHGHANRKCVFEGVPGVMGRSNLRARQAVGGYNLVEVTDGRMTFSERHPGGPTEPSWHSVVLEKHNFGCDTNRYPRPDFSVNAKFPQVKERWSFNTGFTIASTPAIADGLGIVGDASGTVYGFELAGGKIRWRFKAASPVYSTPAVSEDRVVFGCCDGSVYAVRISDGKKVWRHKTSRPIVASPAIEDGKVFIGSSEGKFRALALADGKTVWEFPGLKGFVETRPLVGGGKVIFGAWDQHLYALDEASGKLDWSWRGDRPGTLLSPAACWPVNAAGQVFIAAPDRYMTGLDAATGEQVWRTNRYVVRESIGVSADQTRVYVRAMNDFFYAFSSSARRPELVWQCNAGFGYDINSAMLEEKDGVVFYGTKNGLLFALDSKTGEILWQHKIGVGVVNTVAPLSAREVLAADFDGKVVLVEKQ